jgi:hypothetical protein
MNDDTGQCFLNSSRLAYIISTFLYCLAWVCRIALHVHVRLNPLHNVQEVSSHDDMYDLRACEEEEAA